MKAKNLLALLTLSANLYMISKDEEFMENLAEMLKKGKKKVNEFMDDLGDEKEEGEEQFIQKFMQKAKQAREELEKKIEETAAKVYAKMHIAHSDDLKKVLLRLEIMEKKLNLVEVQIKNMNG